MIGNVWEWTTTEFYPPSHRSTSTAPAAPVKLATAADPTIQPDPQGRLAPVRRVYRYRPAARSPQSQGCDHYIGFRCVADPVSGWCQLHEELHPTGRQSARRVTQGLRMNSTTRAGLAGRGRAQLYGPNGVSLYKHALAGPV